MGLCVVFVNGPRRSGKSALIHMMVDRLWEHMPHYIRLFSRERGKTNSVEPSGPPPECKLASVRRIEYVAEHVFEILPEELTAIHREDRFGSVVVEADTDPVLRHAYPYDHRVMVMSLPTRVHEVFRDPSEAAMEFQRVLDDTQAFASEFFGLDAGYPGEDPDPSEARPELSVAQMRSFLYSPLGDELATRIQLQQPYHGLVESDVIIINTRAGKLSSETSECLRRIKKLLERTRGRSGRKCVVFRCDPCDRDSTTSQRLLEVLEPMCVGGT